ncbi:hypothetical protein NR798_39055 [Archangium gephyra]|uniref:hypothetical protein n=1 Tax=Archangium gephyra TaxID=48 RepID=UPI0035D42109
MGGGRTCGGRFYCTVERFAGESVFGVAADAWGQSFVGVAKEGAPSFRYTKRDAAGQVVFTSKTYAADASVTSPYLDVLGLGVDRSGAPIVFGVSSGAFVFDDGPHGGNKGNFFALRFDP